MDIHEVAAASGLSIDRIRLYERRGILPRPPRRANGYRDYTPDHIATLRLARDLRDLGFPLPEVREVLHEAHDGDCDRLRKAILGRIDEALDELDARITGLERTRARMVSIRDAFRRMRPRRPRVPGTSPCSCCVEVFARDA
jgi:DNA-binding transcriptional MerR regulator